MKAARLPLPSLVPPFLLFFSLQCSDRSSLSSTQTVTGTIYIGYNIVLPLMPFIHYGDFLYSLFMVKIELLLQFAMCVLWVSGALAYANDLRGYENCQCEWKVRKECRRGGWIENSRSREARSRLWLVTSNRRTHSLFKQSYLGNDTIQGSASLIFSQIVRRVKLGYAEL